MAPNAHTAGIPNGQPARNSPYRRSIEHFTSMLSRHASLLSMDVRLDEHFQTFAYVITVAAYMVAIGEYFYLRLASILIDDHYHVHPPCERRAGEIIGKTALHYTAVIIVFLPIALLQQVCFFGLVIVNRWTECRQQLGINHTVRLRHEMANRIKILINKVLYQTFACYLMCAIIVWATIFYVYGIRDAIDQNTGYIYFAIFDVILVSYFLLFPIITIIYHPDLGCHCRHWRRTYAWQSRLQTESGNSTLDDGRHDNSEQNHTTTTTVV